MSARSKGTAAGKGGVAPVQAMEGPYRNHIPSDVAAKHKEVWANMDDRIDRMQVAIGGYEFRNRALCVEAMVQGWSGVKAPQSTVTRHHTRGSMAIIGDAVLKMQVSRGWYTADVSAGELCFNDEPLNVLLTLLQLYMERFTTCCSRTSF